MLAAPQAPGTGWILQPMNETTDATAMFAPVWRRKWLILIIGVLVSVGSYAHYKKAPSKFAVKTQLYLGAAAEGQALLNNTLGKTTLNATAIANQAALINSSIGETVHKAFRKAHNLDAAKGKVKAKATASSSFIVLTAEGHTATAAAQLANAYAQAYIRRHQRNYERAVNLAINTTRKQVKRIEAAEALAKARAKGKGGGSSSASTLQTAALSTKLNQLESDLSVSGVQQIGTAKPAKAELLGPMPKKNAIFGFVIGLVLATLAVYILSRFNRRLRSLADVEAVFKAPILSALPSARTPIVRSDGQVRPSKLLSEPLRRLHSTLQLGGSGESTNGQIPGSILFLSADPGDGKSTLAAGLALVQREAGERAVVIEADFRRPVLAKLLSIDAQGAPGLAELLAGKALPSGAMQRVRSGAPKAEPEVAQPAEGAVAMAVSTDHGSISVLLGSTGVGNPPALLARPEMGELLRSLRHDFDAVLLDAPPPLQVSDVMPLLGAVDGIVIVARINHTRETSARRLMELLARTPSAPVLGVVANAVPRGDIQKYGFSSGSSTGRGALRLFGR
jgi:Mrp family chromosome partitioning ATPase/capsular polysaccharide biosynthesis protein